MTVAAQLNSEEDEKDTSSGKPTSTVCMNVSGFFEWGSHLPSTHSGEVMLP